MKIKSDRIFVKDLTPKASKISKKKGIIEITLDNGVKVKAVGLVYGMEHTITGPNYLAKLFLDHYSQRIRVDYYEGTNIEGMVHKVRSIAEANNFDKIIFKPSEKEWQLFLPFGYVLEAVIKYYRQGESAFVMSKFRSQERLNSNSMMSEILMIEKLMAKPSKIGKLKLDPNYECRLANVGDIEELARLYAHIFQSYPSPLSHTDYLATVFQKMSLFVVITFNGKIISAASAELNQPHKAAELTDCATLEEHRGKGLMTIIIDKLEDELIQRGYICGFTIARARSFGMNQVFYNLKYEFMGRLVNNCDIYGSYEDMNIWVRDLREKKSGSGNV